MAPTTTPASLSVQALPDTPAQAQRELEYWQARLALAQLKFMVARRQMEQAQNELDTVKLIAADEKPDCIYWRQRGRTLVAGVPNCGDVAMTALTSEGAAASERLECEWCEGAAAYSINWECGHTCAMCVLCFEPSDARDWTLDIMDWDSPAICPRCAG